MNPIVWQQGSSTPDHATHFATISQWWAGLNGKEIHWKQRLIAPSGKLEDLSWEAQRFDETFAISNPEIRGITLFWHKPDTKDERSILPQMLQFDPQRQQLYIFPQAQPEVVIQVELPQLVYQKLLLRNPQLSIVTSAAGAALMFRDPGQQLEVQVVLNSEKLAQLKQQLG